MGVDQKDINIVGTAINSLVTLLFSSVDINRQAAIHALDQIGRVQPGFLKAAVKTLMIRFKSGDPEKRMFAAQALDQIFLGKKAERLITDPEVLTTLRQQRAEQEQAAKAAEQRQQQIVKQVQSTRIDLSVVNAFPEIKTIGQYYNNALLNKDEAKAQQILNDFLHDLMEWQKSDRGKFIPGCLLLGVLLSPKNRKAFTQSIIDQILKYYYQGTPVEKEANAEILESIINEIIDAVPPEMAGPLQAEIAKRKQERQAAKQKEIERIAVINKLKVPVNPAWDSNVQKAATDYNQGISENKDRTLKQALSQLEKSLLSNNERERKHATELLGIILGKQPEFVQPLIIKLLQKYTQPVQSEILGEILEDLRKLQWADESILSILEQAKIEREAEKERLRKIRQEEYEKLKEITIKIDGDWDKAVAKVGENLNAALLKQNEKQVRKIINNDIKKLLFAKEEEIRQQGQIMFARIAQKYPQLLSDLMKELVPLYLSEHEQRNIAVDAFGMIYDMGFAEEFFANEFPDVWKILPEDWANRKQEIENLLLQNKFDAIKADVTQIRIRDSWTKNIQKIVRDYNHGIKAKNMEQVFQSVQKIVDIVMNEKKEEIQEQANQVLGLIAKRNIELIQPTIDLFMRLIEGTNRDKKLRAIKGLGEVTRQRPGWAYFGIETLLNITQQDPEPEFRIKAMLEVGRIAEKDPVMLVEHIEKIINALSKDSDKHVRRLAAWTLGNMADAIPLEAQEAIPALTDALHDEYVLVRKFADKALSAIREAMRKQ